MELKGDNLKLLILGVVGGLAALVTVFSLFSGGDKQERTASDSEASTSSWSGFHTELPKEEGPDETLSRGEYIEDELRKEARSASQQEKLERRRNMKKGVKLKNADLGALWNGERKDGESPKATTATPVQTPAEAPKKPAPPAPKKRRATPRKKYTPPAARPQPKTVKRTRKRKSRLDNVWKEPDAATTGSSDQMMKAMTHETMNVKPGSTTRIQVRFTASYNVGGCEIPRDKLFVASVGEVSGSRLFLHLSIPCAGKRIALEAYGEDGQRGIYVSNLDDNNELGKDILDESVAQEAGRITSTIGIPVVGTVIDKVVSSRKKRSYSINLPAGKQIFFKAEE